MSKHKNQRIGFSIVGVCACVQRATRKSSSRVTRFCVCPRVHARNKLKYRSVGQIVVPLFQLPELMHAPSRSHNWLRLGRFWSMAPWYRNMCQSPLQHGPSMVFCIRFFFIQASRFACCSRDLAACTGASRFYARSTRTRTKFGKTCTQCCCRGKGSGFRPCTRVSETVQSGAWLRLQIDDLCILVWGWSVLPLWLDVRSTMFVV